MELNAFLLVMALYKKIALIKFAILNALQLISIIMKVQMNVFEVVHKIVIIIYIMQKEEKYAILALV